ncbi:hypothetical protein LIER_08216 [Lithospermum erythrorhizon]|uniref:Exostosin GT47 domain-containing protein n=1 Tax=Lithospermum erythrorhizon TaxID=34254 RepID=A0AAV3PFT7_LITER
MWRNWRWGIFVLLALLLKTEAWKFPKLQHHQTERISDHSMFSGCIHVIITDDIILPFSDDIPWEDIGDFIAEKDVPKLDTILTSIPIEVDIEEARY